MRKRKVGLRHSGTVNYYYCVIKLRDWPFLEEALAADSARKQPEERSEACVPSCAGSFLAKPDVYDTVVLFS
jgi:hypothetical protein